MSRYIRTKNENNLIIDLNNMLLTYNLADEYIDFNKFGMFEVVKKADTIEELCDEFVAVHHIMDEPVYIIAPRLTGHLSLKEKISLRNRIYTIYGAIWTDKGLIFVARMNNEGVLELL